MRDRGDEGDGSKKAKSFAGDKLTKQIIGAAIRVHNELGPGFDVQIYHNAMAVELATIAVPFDTERPVVIRYRKRIVGKHRIDLLVSETVVVELKVVEELTKRHYRQLKSYLKSAKLNVGLLINFDDDKLDFRRVENTPASP